MQANRPSRFRLLAWGTLGYTLLVVVWGAYVRASGSGAGCGAHWPLCNGVVLPPSPKLATVIEFSHRLTSGLTLLLVGGLAACAYRWFPRGHAARQGAVLSLGFLVLEAGIGAGLVLLKLVAYDASASRAVWVAMHLVNTFLLLAALAYVAWYAALKRAERFVWRAGPGRSAAFLGGFALLLLVGVAGAIVALGDTLFPVTSLAEGLKQDLAPAAHFLIRLRVIHPALAVTAAVYLFVLTTVTRIRDTHPWVGRLASTLNGLVAAQIGLGILNMLLLAPIWLQLLHLAVADGTWVTFILLALQTLAEPDATTAPAAQPVGST